MPRPRISEGGRAVISVSLPDEIFQAIKDHPNRSGYICQLIMLDLNMRGAEKLDTRLSELNDALFSMEKERLSLVSEKNALEAQKNLLQRRQNATVNERLKLLEMFREAKATPSEIRGWLSSRLDRLRDCGFNNTEEGLEWMSKHMEE